MKRVLIKKKKLVHVVRECGSPSFSDVGGLELFQEKEWFVSK